MLELLEFVVKSIVDHKDEVQIEEKLEGKTKVFFVKVNPADMGGIIGKGGNTAQAVRTIVKSVNPHERIVVKFNPLG